MQSRRTPLPAPPNEAWEERIFLSVLRIVNPFFAIIGERTRLETHLAVCIAFHR